MSKNQLEENNYVLCKSCQKTTKTANYCSICQSPICKQCSNIIDNKYIVCKECSIKPILLPETPEKAREIENNFRKSWNLHKNNKKEMSYYDENKTSENFVCEALDKLSDLNEEILNWKGEDIDIIKTYLTELETILRKAL